MATYVIQGHPLNTSDLAASPGATVDANLAAALRNNGVGASVTLVLAGADATQAQALDALE